MTRFAERPAGLYLLEPWIPVDAPGGEALVNELYRELTDGHVLRNVPVTAVAMRIDRDDVLFATNLSEAPLAVVHLTWRGRAEIDPTWPHTTTHGGWEDWIARCMIPDLRNYSDESE